MVGVAEFPIRSARGWLGDSLRKLTDWQYTLTDLERSEIDAALTHILSLNKTLLEVTKMDFPLPRFGPILRRITADLEKGVGFALLRGMPVESRSEEEVRWLAWGLSLHVGVAMPQNDEGCLVDDIRDKGKSRTDAAVSRGSRTNSKLSFHCDPCDVVALLCRRAARSGGRSRISSTIAVHDAIAAHHPHLLQTLYRPFPFVKLGHIGENDQPFYLCPIFGWRDGHIASHFYKHRILIAADMPGAPGLTPEQRDAVALVEQIAGSPEFFFEFDVRPGDLHLTCNHLIFHARTAYEDDPRPECGRHLLRFWLSVPDSRPLPATFEEFFGHTDPGIVRGGLRRWNSMPHIQAYQARVAASLGMPVPV